MAKQTHASVTEEPCRCFYLQRQADDPHSPIVFDSAMNEYRFEYLDPEGNGEPHSIASLCIYHCPFCGGAAPESTRGKWFAEVAPEEMNRLMGLFQGIKSAEDAIATLGPPTHDDPAGESVRRALLDGSLGPTQVFRTLRYSNLSTTAEVSFNQAADGTTHLSINGRYLGPPATE
ncbi:hypothetical protein NA78x_001240 [Anatilimnocola sp. NA78]|uniref:hypothetical protein n=1 Tax=Anatilimnocola sp. NA78 TaxID=3415683 RepID=UPI003CE5772E